MYTLPKNYNLNKYKNACVAGLSFTSNTVVFIIKLDNQEVKNFRLEGHFVIDVNDISTRYENIFPVSTDMKLLNLIDKHIKKAYTNASRDKIFFEFEGKIKLTIISNPNYESFFILDDEGIII